MGKKTVKTSLPTDRTMYKLIQALKDVAVYPEVIDNLNSTDTDKPLSANQGKVISGDLAGIRGSADAYDPDNTDYAAGDPCINNNILYIAKQAITHPAGSFDAAKWTESSLKTLMEGATANSSAINAIIGNIYYNANTDRTVEDNRVSVMNYLLSNYFTKGSRNTAVVRYSGGHYFSYLYIGQNQNGTRKLIEVQQSMSTYMAYWDILSDGSGSKTWEL